MRDQYSRGMLSPRADTVESRFAAVLQGAEDTAVTMSLKTKLTFGVSLLVAGITTATGLLFISYFQQQLMNNVAAEQFTLISTIAGHVDDNLLDAQKELVTMAKSLPRECLADAGSAQRFLDDRGRTETGFDNSIALFSPDGTLIAETPFVPGRRGMNFAFRDYFKSTLASGKPLISRPYFSSKAHQHPAIMFTVPLFNSTGALTGVLAGSVDLTTHNFLGRLGHISIGKSGYLYLFDTERTMIMHPDERRILTKDVPPGINRGFDRAVAGFEGTVETVNSKGLLVLATFKRLQATNWVLAANFPLEEAYASINRAKQYLVAALFGTITLAMAVVWFYLKCLTAPLQRFTGHIRAITGKRGADRLFFAHTCDEIGVLAEAFNGMVRELDDEREALRKSERHLAEAQRLAHVGNWELEVGTGRVTWSDEMYRITGLGRDDFAGTSRAFLDLIHPDDRPLVARIARDAQVGGSLLAVEHRFVQPNGSVRTVHLIAEVSFEGDELPARVFGTVQDITEGKEAERERQQAEEALRESEERFRQIAEHCKEVFFLVTSDLERTIYISPAYETLWQQSCQSLYERPRSFTDIIHEEDKPRISAALEQLLKQGDAFDESYRIVRPDRSVCWVHVRTYPVRAGNGEIYRYVGIAEDVTEQKLAEAQTRKLQQAVEQSPVTIVITDSAGTIEYVNPKFTQLTGYSFSEAVGQNPRLLKSGKMDPDVYTQLWESLSNGKEWHGELLNRKKNGDHFWESASISPIKNASGETTHYLGVKEDITERKEVEKELKQAKAAAEEASRLKSEFLANMSHEIRTPMNGVIGMTELLSDTELGEEQREYVQAVKSSADLLLSVINDILDFSKIEARKLELESVHFNLRDILATMLQTFAFAAAEKSLELALSVSPDVPDILMGDPVRLRQVISNLVANAIKFTDCGGVTLAVAREPGGTDGVILHCTVTDTGIGIPAEKQKLIFAPFSQADASTTRKYGGSGLGLSISSRLVEMMGGRLWVESRVGKGSAFHFTVQCGLQQKLPDHLLPDEYESPLAASRSARGGRGPLSILLAEDNPINQRIAVRILETQGHSVTVVSNGKEAVARMAVQGNGFGLVLMDVQMYGMDGFEATSLIRAEEKVRGGQIPIIALTAHAMEGDRERCLLAGMDGYVAKPFKARDLLAAIETVLHERGENGQEVTSAQRDDAGVFDHERTLAGMDCDWELFYEIVGIFAEDSPKLLAEIRDAIDAGDAIRLNRAAHKLGGSVSNFRAGAPRETALKLEQMGKQGELDGAPELYAALEREVAFLQWSLATINGGGNHENTHCRG